MFQRMMDKESFGTRQMKASLWALSLRPGSFEEYAPSVPIKILKCCLWVFVDWLLQGELGPTVTDHAGMDIGTVHANAK